MKKIALFMILASLTILAQEKKEFKMPDVSLKVLSTYVQNEDKESFSAENIRFFLKGNAIEKLSYFFMAEFNGDANTPMMLDAWLTYSYADYLNIKFGQIFFNFGHEGAYRKFQRKFINPSFVVSKIEGKMGATGSYLRDIGVEVRGMYKFNKEIGIDYNAFLFNGNGINTSDNNKNKDWMARLQFVILDMVKIGGSYYKGFDGAGGMNEEDAYAIHGVFENENATVYAEYLDAEYESGFNGSGFLAAGIYRPLKNIELGLRYDQLKPEVGVEGSRVTGMGAYYFDKFNRIFVNYENTSDIVGYPENNFILGVLVGI